ncbi:DUF1778 domain-containing protein [Frankia sp. Cr2]|uniref:type II toxin-antitoxin system TacA family antitoxin n=1 Tax=Frankia sp. Cr2 TaxID=3073932 RepID=UPI002AD3B1B3|nr:DUF1778 domain-containing protein [Frankia sp. Cr2]
MAASVASSRFEFRMRPDLKEQIEYAAALVNESVSDFARTAAEERALTVLREHSVMTMVPAEFFDSLLAALDEPGRPDEALASAARRINDVVTRR